MAMYKCPTLGDCDHANAGKIFELAPGENLNCPGCSTPLEPQIMRESAPGINMRIVIAAVAAAVAIVGAGGGYYYQKTKTAAVEATAIEANSASASDAAIAKAPASSAIATVVPESSSAAAVSASAATGGIAPTDTSIKADRAVGTQALTQGNAAGAESASNQAAAKEMVKVAIAKMSQGKLDEAEKDLNDALARDSKQPLVYYNMAILRLKQNRTDDALKQFEASFLNGFKFFDAMDKDPDLDSIRNDPRFTDLVKEYRTPPK